VRHGLEDGRPRGPASGASGQGQHGAGRPGPGPCRLLAQSRDPELAIRALCRVALLLALKSRLPVPRTPARSRQALRTWIQAGTPSPKAVGQRANLRFKNFLRVGTKKISFKVKTSKKQ